MSPRLILPSVLALVTGGGFFAWQQLAVSRQEKENAGLEGRIRVQESLLTASPTGADEIRRPVKRLAQDGPRGVARMAAVFLQTRRDSLGSFQALRMHRELRELDADTLEKLLDEARATLSPEEREPLVRKLIEALSEKEPARAMVFVEEGFKGLTAPQLARRLEIYGGVFDRLAKSDAAGAAAWLDRQIAEGRFEDRSLGGKSTPRTSYETSLLKSLLSEGSTTAADRIASWSPEITADVFGKGSSWRWQDLSPSAQTSFAALVRDALPEAMRSDALANPMSGMLDSGFERVDGYLGRIGATGEELGELRLRAAAQRLSSGGGRNAADLARAEEVRNWMLVHQAADAERATGEALGRYYQQQSGPAMRLVVGLNGRHPSDEMLAGFVASLPQGVPPETLVPIRFQNDEARRQAFERFGNDAP